MWGQGLSRCEPKGERYQRQAVLAYLGSKHLRHIEPGAGFRVPCTPKAALSSRLLVCDHHGSESQPCSASSIATCIVDATELNRWIWRMSIPGRLGSCNSRIAPGV
jgi:hypothetical protein